MLWGKKLHQNKLLGKKTAPRWGKVLHPLKIGEKYCTEALGKSIAPEPKYTPLRQQVARDQFEEDISTCRLYYALTLLIFAQKL